VILFSKERETLMQIKSFTPENKIPPGLITSGVDAIRGGKLLTCSTLILQALGNFDKAKSADKVNEKRPDAPQEPIVNVKLHSLRQSQENLLAART
jgi:hypothetical protein